jgi:hypothetical protein
MAHGSINSRATKTFQGSPESKITAKEWWRYHLRILALARNGETRGSMPSIIDLDAEAAKLTMFRGQTPQTTRAERKGSTTQLARYRDGLLLLGKSAGRPIPRTSWFTFSTERRHSTSSERRGRNLLRSAPE